MFQKTKMDKFNAAYLRIINECNQMKSKKQVIKEDEDKLTDLQIQILKAANENQDYTADEFQNVADIDFGPNDQPDAWDSLKDRGYLEWNFQRDDDFDEDDYDDEGYGYAPDQPGMWPCWHLSTKGEQALKKLGQFED